MIQSRNHAGPDRLRTLVPADPAAAYATADPADRGLDVLRRHLGSCPGVVIDRGSTLFREIGYAHWERAMDLCRDMMSGSEIPPGLRGLAWLSGIHGMTIANGLNAAIEVRPPQQLDEAVATLF